MAGAAADVGDPGAGVEAFGEAAGEGHDAVDQDGVEGAPAEPVHDVGEVGPVLRIRNPAALPERLRDRLDELRQVTVDQAQRRHVELALAGQADGVLAGREYSPVVGS